MVMVSSASCVERRGAMTSSPAASAEARGRGATQRCGRGVYRAASSEAAGVRWPAGPPPPPTRCSPPPGYNTDELPISQKTDSATSWSLPFAPAPPASAPGSRPRPHRPVAPLGFGEQQQRLRSAGASCSNNAASPAVEQQARKGRRWSSSQESLPRSGAGAEVNG